MLVFHAVWTRDGLALWAESARRLTHSEASPGVHPFAADADEMLGVLSSVGPTEQLRAGESIALRLPHRGGIPLPSARLSHTLGRPGDDEGAELAQTLVGSLVIGLTRVGDWLGEIEDAARDVPGEILTTDASVSFFAAADRLARRLLAQQRFVPMLCSDGQGRLTAAWSPWLGDERASAIAAELVLRMPPSARAGIDEFAHEPWPILDDFLSRTLDASCRRSLAAEHLAEAIEGRETASSLEVSWLSGLLGSEPAVPSPSSAKPDLVRHVRRWIAALDDRGLSARWRLLFRLREPELAPDADGSSARWPLTFHLQSSENHALVLDAEDVWAMSSDSITIDGARIDAPHELLLSELARATRLLPVIERSLEDDAPTGIDLSTTHAYQFLREQRSLLSEQGFGVEVPEWWDSPTVRLGARLRIWSHSPPTPSPGHAPGVSGESRLGLESLVGYTWEIAIGGTTITLAEFEQLARKRSPLLRINGRWVEVRPDDVRAAMKFIEAHPGGSMRFADAMRLAYAGDSAEHGIPVVGLEAEGWVRALIEPEARFESLEVVETPPGFQGVLRPYQVRGLSWLVLLERLGFGACLADDMGLGKTVQVLALLEREREHRAASGEPGLPTLLVAPMSVVGNWVHEARRFAPELKVIIHHGLERSTGDTFVDRAMRADAVITTYALAHRDRATLERVAWGRVVLDEAQCIKNPVAKQSQAVRSLAAPRRIALTGTPVENRLTELWSIVDFLNPRYLGSSSGFRSRFCVPIERYRDQARARQLRAFVQPFVLRRLKTDEGVAADLPDKVETREYCHMTSEQASLYESCVQRMLTEVDRTTGMERRGLVLAALIRLKQICNHPSQFLKDHPADAPVPAEASRSGKCLRLVEILREIVAGNDQALIFTQFRQMGLLLAPMLRLALDREILFFHGGTTQKQREDLVTRFQKSEAQVLIVSLKAGGVGLNLTAATHVVHFDRWWNPAVENQATDRTHRIGQTRSVQVHKFVVSGTLEERIDEMIDQKTELAEQIVGSGERWLTELSTDQLRDLLRLRRDAISDED